MSHCIVHPSAILDVDSKKSQFNTSTKKAHLRLPTSTSQQGGKSNNTASLPVDTSTPLISAPTVGYADPWVIFILHIVYADVVRVRRVGRRGRGRRKRAREVRLDDGDTPDAVFNLLFEEDASYVRAVADLHVSSQGGVFTHE
jgi:hypothetical protein